MAWEGTQCEHARSSADTQLYYALNRAAAIHNAATDAAINSAYVHAQNAEAYGTQYNELMDKYHELEQHRHATDASTRTAKVAAEFASAARRDAERHRDVAKHAAHVAVTGM